jgi:hypothetical protein
MKTLIRLMSLTLLLFSLVAVSTSTAAPAVGTAKARGDYSPGAYWGRSGGRSIRHARDYSRGYRWYARRAPSITPQIARNEAAGLGQNITAAQRQFAEVRKVTAATDKETLASLDLIDQQLAAAAKAHATMHEMCKAETIDAAGTMKCCDDVDAALAKAITEHEKLMKRLQGETSPTPPSN